MQLRGDPFPFYDLSQWKTKKFTDEHGGKPPEVAPSCILLELLVPSFDSMICCNICFWSKETFSCLSVNPKSPVSVRVQNHEIYECWACFKTSLQNELVLPVIKYNFF